MTRLLGFEYDLFISYAHTDNVADSRKLRWISGFQADLAVWLERQLGRKPSIFFDARGFDAHDHVDILLERVRRSAVFIAMSSPSYMGHKFTIKELETYCERGRDARAIVTVDMLPVDDDRRHPLLRGYKRTPFWKEHPEHGIPLLLSPDVDQDYYTRVQLLAAQLEKLLLEDLPGLYATRPKPLITSAEEAAGQVVLVAQSTDDLYDSCQRTRAYLEQFGVTVLPEDDYPQGGPGFAAAVDADVARASLFVQLLGDSGSRKPPDLEQTYAQYQYEAAKRRALKIMQWRRPDTNLIITHRDRDLLYGPEVLAIGLEEFKAEILRACKVPRPKQKPTRHSDFHVFINVDRSDRDIADALLAALENQKTFTTMRPLFEGSATEIAEDLETNLKECEALLVIYGNASPGWVRAQLVRYRKLEKGRDVPPRLKTLLLAPPTPKADLGYSSGTFEKIDCLNDDVVRRVQELLAEI